MEVVEAEVQARLDQITSCMYRDNPNDNAPRWDRRPERESSACNLLNSKLRLLSARPELGNCIPHRARLGPRTVFLDLKSTYTG